MTEIWKDIKEYEGKYQISNTGKVRSLVNNKNKIRTQPKILKPYLDKDGYEIVRLSKNGKLKAFKNHKKFFNENYNINSFAMVSAFQKYVTTRKMSGNSGGTGLTTLINALIEKSTLNFCYAISGNTNLLFKKDFLNINEDGLIGFNKENNYIEMIPDKKVVSINNYDMNANIYNLQFILKEN